jgi:hypothetical protein
MAEALGWELSDFDRCFAELEREEMVVADWRHRLVYLPGALQQPENRPMGTNVAVMFRRVMNDLPQCDLWFQIEHDLRLMLFGVSNDLLQSYDSGRRSDIARKRAASDGGAQLSLKVRPLQASVQSTPRASASPPQADLAPAPRNSNAAPDHHNPTPPGSPATPPNRAASGNATSKRAFDAIPPSRGLAQEALALELMPPPRDARKSVEPARPDVERIMKLYKAKWVTTFRPHDGQPPNCTKADWRQLHLLVAQYGADQTRRFVLHYLDDSDRFLEKLGHPLRMLPSRVDGYRATRRPQAAQRDGWQEPEMSEAPDGHGDGDEDGDEDERNDSLEPADEWDGW